MLGNELFDKVNKKEVVNGTKFDVYESYKDGTKGKKIGTIGVIDTTIVFLDMPIFPTDLYSGNYCFEEVKDEN